MIENAKYIKSDDGTRDCAINCTINGQQWSVPIDPANTDYQNIMQLVAEGKLVIAPAD